MKSRRWIVLFALAAVATALLVGTIAARNEQVTICHIPPGNPSNAHTITVSESAVPAHQAHGDTLGPCPASPSR